MHNTSSKVATHTPGALGISAVPEHFARVKLLKFFKLLILPHLYYTFNKYINLEWRRSSMSLQDITKIQADKHTTELVPPAKVAPKFIKDMWSFISLSILPCAGDT